MRLRSAAISALSVLLLAPAFSLVSAAPSDAAAGGRFVTTWDTAPDATIELYLYGDVDVSVSWGDGTSTVVDAFRAPASDPGLAHTYVDGGATHRVVVTGTFGRFGSNFRSPDGLQTVEEWDATSTTDLSFAFYGAQQLRGVAEIPDGVTDLSYAFSSSTFNGPLAGLDVSSVENMEFMFQTSAFDQPIGDWDVSRVTTMAHMFTGASSDAPADFRSPFNQPIGDWDVSHVTTMDGMFSRSLFNQPIGSWDVSSVTNLNWVFLESPFNQPIGDWDVSHVTTVYGTFGRSPFNQPIGDWDVSGITDESLMGWTFWNADRFNQDLSSWCVPTIRRAPYFFDEGADAWTRPRPRWGTCPGDGSDIVDPSGSFGSVAVEDRIVRLTGRASDDRGVRNVAVTIRNPATGRWLQRDGTWGGYQKLYAKVGTTGATSTGWKFRRAVPAGTFGISLVVVDTSGNSNPEPRPWRRIIVR